MKVTLFILKSLILAGLIYIIIGAVYTIYEGFETSIMIGKSKVFLNYLTKEMNGYSYFLITIILFAIIGFFIKKPIGWSLVYLIFIYLTIHVIIYSFTESKLNRLGNYLFIIPLIILNLAPIIKNYKIEKTKLTLNLVLILTGLFLNFIAFKYLIEM